MSNSFHLKLVTPERILFEGDVRSATLPTEIGEITILPDHMPLVSSVANGVATLQLEKGVQEDIAISGGFIQIKHPNQVIILAQMAELASGLDLKIIEEAKARAEAAMKEKVRTSDEEFAETAAVLNRELARYKAAIKYRHRTGGGHDHTPNPLAE